MLILGIGLSAINTPSMSYTRLLDYGLGGLPMTSALETSMVFRGCLLFLLFSVFFFFLSYFPFFFSFHFFFLVYLFTLHCPLSSRWAQDLEVKLETEEHLGGGAISRLIDRPGTRSKRPLEAMGNSG